MMINFEKFDQKKILMPNEQVIGIQRVLETQKGHTWNNKKLRWSIVHNFNNESKPYEIELEMVLVSSKRVLKVNQQVKNVQMCSFGYEVNFQINQRLKGYIKQDSLTFELFINGKSFTSLQSNTQSYQPPKLQPANDNVWVNKNYGQQKSILSSKTKKQPPHQKVSTQQSPPVYSSITKAKSMEQQQKPPVPSTPSLKTKQFSLIETKVQKKQVQNTIKDTQSELMRILMQEKKKKKLQQQLLHNQ